MHRALPCMACASTCKREGLLTGLQSITLSDCMPGMCAGGSISQIRLNCRGSYSRVIGLIRLGKQLSQDDEALASSQQLSQT